MLVWGWCGDGSGWCGSKPTGGFSGFGRGGKELKDGFMREVDPGCSGS